MGKCRVFTIDDDLQEVVADGLYMKSMLGDEISVSVVKFVQPKGGELPAKAHAHGEEASLQIAGSCTVFEGDGNGEADAAHALRAGEAMLIPAQLSHYGANQFGSEGASMRLNVVTPPRKEFGKSGTQAYYPLQDGQQAEDRA